MHIRITDKYILFWGSEFSNFYPYESKNIKTEDVKPLDFELDGNKWKTSEHYFMYQKAIYFHDYETANKIKLCIRPEEAKRLGKQVNNFDALEWNKVSFDIMYKGVYAKFSQNDKLRKIILDESLAGKSFVEASPFDRIWGIGLHYEDKRCDNSNNWLGENRLGKVLDKVRSALLSSLE